MAGSVKVLYRINIMDEPAIGLRATYGFISTGCKETHPLGHSALVSFDESQPSSSTPCKVCVCALCFGDSTPHQLLVLIRNILEDILWEKYVCYDSWNNNCFRS
ncbi:hypothetical protein CBL_11418 [Carabus blaptoides fortunei]